jgi:hypothetical protein
MSINKKISALTKEEFAELESACKCVFALGGLKQCKGLNLEKFERILNLPKIALLKWFRKNNKKFVKNLR